MIEQYARLGATIVPRAKRVAFLVDESFDDQDINNLVKYCIQHLGGRFNPIVPLHKGTLSDSWQKILSCIDPDVIYSFTELDPQFIENLTEKLRLTRLIFANRAHKHETGWHVSSDEIGDIAMTDVVLPYKPTIFSKPSIPRITVENDDFRKGDAINFCLRNFGAFPNADWKEWNFRVNGIELLPVPEIGSPIEFLNEMLPLPGKVFPREFSTVGFNRFGFDRAMNRSDQLYEIVIGDSLRDFLYVWNQSIMSFFDWRHRSIWFPLSSIKSPKFAESASNWFRSCVFSSEPSSCRIVSYSTEENTLAEVRSEVHQIIKAQTSFKCLQRDETCDFVDLAIEGEQTAGSRYDFLAKQEVFGLPLPKHVQGSSKTKQGWIVEIEFDSPPGRDTAIFKKEKWPLPKRYLLDKKFLEKSVPSKVTSRGCLAVEVHSPKPTFRINVPTIREICDVMIVSAQVEETENGFRHRAGKFRYIDTSSDGQFFMSAIQLFGGLEKASAVLDDKGWREVLFAMIGDKQVLQEEIDELLSNYLSKLKATDNPDAHFRGKLRRTLSNAIVAMPNEFRYVHKTRIKELLETAGTILPDQDDDYVKKQLHSFLSRSIFFQGAAARCYHCGSSRWHTIENLRANMTCHGCSNEFWLEPLDAPTYKLNDLLVNGFRRFGFLPVFQALFELSHQAKNHLLFIPQQNLFDWDTDEETAVTDLDLVGIMDRKFFIGEVKSSQTGIDHGQVKLARGQLQNELFSSF